jgi:hypothetical protein
MITGAKPGLEEACAAAQIYYTDNYLFLDGVSTSCFNPSGIVMLDSTLSLIRFEYSLSQTDIWNEPREYHTFHGHRIN